MFEATDTLSSHHLIPQPRDLALQPPEGYFWVQDFLIISCGVLYALCYVFYMARTWRDGKLAGFVEFLAGTISYEIFYALKTTTTSFERLSFLVWFLLDISFATVALTAAYAPGARRSAAIRTFVGVLVGLGTYAWLAKIWPDEREQLTAYWAGLALQFPIGWGSLYLLLREGDAKGHSVEIWLTRYLGCVTAYGVFIWRYVNVPSNWAYVGSKWSWWVIGLTMLPETVYPFVLVKVHREQKAGEARSKGEVAGNGYGNGYANEHINGHVKRA